MAGSYLLRSRPPMPGGERPGCASDGTQITSAAVTLTSRSDGALEELRFAGVFYANGDEDPTAGDRTIQVVVNDGTAATSTIQVIPVNEPDLHPDDFLA